MNKYQVDEAITWMCVAGVVVNLALGTYQLFTGQPFEDSFQWASIFGLWVALDMKKDADDE